MTGKIWDIGDIVSPGKKKITTYDSTGRYESLNYNSLYIVINTYMNPFGKQSVMLKIYKKGFGYVDEQYNETGRWYSADDLNASPGYTNDKRYLETPTPSSDKPNLAEAILGGDSTTAAKVEGASEDNIPTAIVVDLQTGAVVYTENKGRSLFVAGDSSYDKTATMGGTAAFVANALKKNPNGAFAVYDLSRVGRVSEIKVSWT